MAVCEFCKTTLLKDAESVTNLGKMSEVLEDYSPLQLGTSGTFAGRSFSLIGRLQLQYSDGFWNEWYLLFDDGSAGWLSDASGQFTLTHQVTAGHAPPAFEKLAPGYPLSAGGKMFNASDVRTARCTAGQGELPFKVGSGYVARVADFRTDDRFLTLDYSDGDALRMYSGQAVELADLKPQLLRDAATIKDAAGHFRGKVSALTCPSCGAAVKCVPGVTIHVVCPNCQATVDTSGSIATVLAAGQAVEQQRFALELGTEANIAGVRYVVLGAMRRSDGEGEWSEYLLYAPGTRFLWLIETAEGWQRAEVLDRWPIWDSADRVSIGGQPFTKSSQYDARVVFAAGSFNWRVKVGDTVHVTEFSNGPLRLAAEISREEMTWSRSSVVALDQVRAWLGDHVHAEEHPLPDYRKTAKRILGFLLIVNAIPLLLAPGSVLFYLLVAAAAIYGPAYLLDSRKS
jgi:uncharacterized protein DUF4178